jgi:hypothetical protein
MGEIGRQSRHAVHGNGVVAARMAGIDREPDPDDGTGKNSNPPPPENSQRSVLI